jgi:hypothetical protein
MRVASASASSLVPSRSPQRRIAGGTSDTRRGSVTSTSTPARAQRLDVLAAVLLRVGEDDVRLQVEDSSDVGVFVPPIRGTPQSIPFGRVQ